MRDTMSVGRLSGQSWWLGTGKQACLPRENGMSPPVHSPPLLTCLLPSLCTSLSLCLAATKRFSRRHHNRSPSQERSTLLMHHEEKMRASFPLSFSLPSPHNLTLSLSLSSRNPFTVVATGVTLVGPQAVLRAPSSTNSTEVSRALTNGPSKINFCYVCGFRTFSFMTSGAQFRDLLWRYEKIQYLTINISGYSCITSK